MKKLLLVLVVLLFIFSFLIACAKESDNLPGNKNINNTNEDPTSNNDEELTEWKTVGEITLELPIEYQTYIDYGEDDEIYAAFMGENAYLFVSKEDYQSLKAKGYDPDNMTAVDYAERWRLLIKDCVMSPEETLQYEGLVYLGYYRIKEDSSAVSYVTFFFDNNETFWALDFNCPRYSDESFSYEELFYQYLDIAKSVTFKE